MASRYPPDPGSDPRWSELSRLIADSVGLHFPRERLGDLQRGVANAAEELGFDDIDACRNWLLSAPLTKAHLGVLASHLTIGETYFFREKNTLDVLASRVLPELIQARRGREQRLRLWSAGCCSGEEAYSLAILLHQVLPDLADWHVTILATDINPRALRRAVAGSYGEWSFRGVPDGFKTRYFIRTGDGRYTIRPELKRLVTFESLNLVEDVYPSLATGTNAMDLVFCRNVLMYFTPEQTGKAIRNLHHALIDGGWLAVSPSEASQALFPQFITQNFPGVILYQKIAAGARASQTWTAMPHCDVEDVVAPAATAPSAGVPPAPPPEMPPPAEARHTPYAAAASLFDEGRYGEAAEMLLASFTEHTRDPEAFSLLARALANQGRLADALAWCDRWIAADKLDAAGHYVRAAILLERGQHGDARRSLQRAIYLDPDFVLAHFALGNLARSRDHHDEAHRHYVNALRLLSRLHPDDPLPQSDGVTSRRLTDTIAAMTAGGNRTVARRLV